MKRKARIAIDISMEALLVALFGYNIIGAFLHELIGIILFSLFIAHNILNHLWYKTLFAGRYNPHRLVQTIINVTLLLAMVATAITGVLISKDIFKFNLDFDVYIYNLHKGLGYYSLMLSSIHLGMHLIALIDKIKKPIAKRAFLLSLAIFIGLLVYVIIDLKIYEYLIFAAGFRFYENNPIKFYFEVIFFILGFATIGIYLSLSLRKSMIGKRKGRQSFENH